MKRFKAFVYIFCKSLVSPKYYNDVVKAKVGLSVKYFLSLAFVFSIISTIAVLIPMIPEVTGFADGVLTKAADFYEDDLVITSVGGELSINKPEPYIIPLAGFLEGFDEVDFGDEGWPENLIVFDSKGTIDDLTDTYDTFILVNKTNVIAREENGIRVESLKDLPDGEFKKADLEELIVKAEKFVAYIPYILGVVVFAGIALYFLFVRFISLVFVAGALWFIGRIRGLAHTFSVYFKIALHAVTLPLLLELLTGMFGVTIPLPFWFFVVNLIFGVVVLFKLETSVAPAPSDQLS